jgi:hypothetical protein
LRGCEPKDIFKYARMQADVRVCSYACTRMDVYYKKKKNDIFTRTHDRGGKLLLLMEGSLVDVYHIRNNKKRVHIILYCSRGTHARTRARIMYMRVYMYIHISIFLRVDIFW